MYYLIIENLGVERCIHRSSHDRYRDGMSFSCTPDLEFPGGMMLREISITCSEVPHPFLRARVYRDHEQ
jgi:hypothetical protein